MLLKRVYDSSDPAAPQLDHVRLLHAGVRQRFSPRFLHQAQADGWVILDGDRLMFQTRPVVTYRVERPPGTYCCHCGAAAPGTLEAQAHLKAVHAGVRSPDPMNPAGYRRDNFYECRREGPAPELSRPAESRFRRVWAALRRR